MLHTSFAQVCVLAAALFCMSPMGMTYAQQDAKPVFVMMKTSAGEFVLELDPQRAPLTVANFVAYVKSGHYEGTVFHRVIKDFMIQGGGYAKDDLNREKKTLPPVKNEGGNGLSNVKYSIAMARTSDPDSATSQFFINTKDNDFLDRRMSRDGFGYTVFGKVVKGQETVDAIASGSVMQKGGERSFPVKPVVIEQAQVVSQP